MKAEESLTQIIPINFPFFLSKSIRISYKLFQAEYLIFF